MAMVGWFIVCIIALLCTVGTILILVLGSAFSGRFQWEGLLPAAIATVLWYIAYNHAPFTVVLQS